MDELQNSRFTKFRTIMREFSRRRAVCGLFTSFVLMAGCDPCMNNPCDNGLACDGFETCTSDGGQAVCTDGTPVECEFPTFCTEPDAACVDPCDGADCSDDDDCTTDTCITNADGTTMCESDTGCDDADPCTEGDTCDDTGVCAGTAIECATGEVCVDGVCVCADDSACDDGDACTGTETCDVETGECVAGTPVECDDGVFCNGAEICEPDSETGEANCLPGSDPCAEGESCDEESGECFTSCSDSSGCDDGDPCTDDTCGLSNFCLNTPVVCSEGETCDEATGECSDGSPAEVDVLQFGDFFYPTGMFFCGAAEDPQPADDFCTEGAGCDEAHWHSGTVAAIASTSFFANLSGNSIDDPDQCFCGHGKVSEVTRTTIEVEQSELADFLSAGNLTELPTAANCP